jgi:proline iminopeptidase
MRERVDFVTADDGCRLWSVRADQGNGAGNGADGGAQDTAAGARGGARHGFVLCHGGPGYWDTLGPLAALIDGPDPIVRWDQRGGGRSQWQGPYTVARFVADLDAVRAHHGFETFTLVGHSWGATLALMYALEHGSRVRRLVYLSGSGLGQSWRAECDANTRAALEPYTARIAELEAVGGERTAEQERALWRFRVAAEFPDRSTALEYAQSLVAELFDEDDEVAPSLVRESRSWSEADLVDRCARLAVPTLILDGAADLRPRWAVDSLAEVLPRCTRVSLADAGHYPWLDKPAELAAALRGFLERDVDVR